MRTFITLGFLFICGLIFAQSPGGVSNAEIWAKIVFQNPNAYFKDFGSHNKLIDQLEFNDGVQINGYPALRFDSGHSASFDQSVEELNTGTFFMLIKPAGFSTNSEQALMHSEWKNGLSGIQENFIQFSTKLVDKQKFDLYYPNTGWVSYYQPSIKTLTWHDYNSRQIARSFGTTEESKFFIGSSFNYNRPVGPAINIPSLDAYVAEFMFFSRSLSELERIRVESYLALKYGITLGPSVDYLNSLNTKFWKKQNNVKFNSKIFGIGSDPNSDLLLATSTSSHYPDHLILSTTENIQDYNYITIGDNGGNYNQLSNDSLASNIRILQSVWLVQTTGPQSNEIKTQLKYKVEGFSPPGNDEAVWFIVDRSASNESISDFTGLDVEFNQITSLNSGYIEVNDYKWNENQLPENSIYDQFTFGIGPRMIVAATLLPMECTDLQGDVYIRIIGGVAPYHIEITGSNTNEIFDLQGNTCQKTLPNDIDTIHVTDHLGYEQKVMIEISPTPGIYVDLGPDQIIPNNNPILLDAGILVTADNVFYQWFRNDELLEGDTNSTLLVSISGRYKVEIRNSINDCVVSDEVLLFKDDGNPIDVVLYPNPVKPGSEISLVIALEKADDIYIQVTDVFGKVLFEDKVTNTNKYNFKSTFNNRGVFFMKVTTSKDISTKKLIVN